MNIILDIIVSNYTSLNSYFFLNVLNNRNFAYVIYTGLIIDFVICNSYGFVTICLVILYFIDQLINNYYLKNIINYVSFLLLISIIFNHSFKYLLLTSFPIQTIYIILMNHHIIKR